MGQFTDPQSYTFLDIILWLSCSHLLPPNCRCISGVTAGSGRCVRSVRHPPSNGAHSAPTLPPISLHRPPFRCTRRQETRHVTKTSSSMACSIPPGPRQCAAASRKLSACSNTVYPRLFLPTAKSNSPHRPGLVQYALLYMALLLQVPSLSLANHQPAPLF